MVELIGQPINRIDGPLKVSGRATYAAEHWNVAQPLSVPGNPRPGPPPCAGGGGACGAGGAAGAWAPRKAVQTKTAAAATALMKDVLFIVCILHFALRIHTRKL